MNGIRVRFTNGTPVAVAFFLNGGGGLQTSLGPGGAQAYSMVVDPGVQPVIGIHQPTGERLDFTVADQGNYVFQFQNGKIVNAIAPAASPIAEAPPIETCVLTLRWQDGSGFVPAWFEADVTGAGGRYIAGSSARFSIIPGDAFWLGTAEVKAAHANLVSQLTAAGWQQIGQGNSDWWSTQLRRHV